MAEKDTETDDYPTEPLRDFQPKPEPNKRTYFNRLNAFLDVILKSIAVFSLIILIIFICIEVKRNSVTIESFDVPKELQDQGYTGRVFVNKLLDQINLIKRTAKTPDIRTFSLQLNTNITSQREIPSPNFIKETQITAWKSPDFLPFDKLVEIEVKVPGTGFSLKSLLHHTRLKEILGHSSMRIVCEVTMNGNKDHPKLTTRVIGKPPKIENFEITNLDSIFLEAAKYIYRYTDPLTLAAYYFSNKHYDNSLETIRYYLQNDSPEDTCFAYNLWGMILYHQNKSDDAIDKYKKVLEIKSQFVPAYLNWGLTLYFQKKYEESIEKYKEIININKKFTYAYFYWGLALHDQAKYDEAIEKYKMAIEIDPQFVPAYNYWGVVLRTQRNYEGAIEKFKKAIEIDPQYITTYDSWGILLSEQEKYDEAIDKYKKAIEIDPQSAQIYNNLGNVLFIQKRYGEAIEKFKKATEIDPPSAIAYCNWGRALYYQKEYDGAIKNYNKATEIDPQFAPAYSNWGLALHDQQKYDDAIEKYNKAIEIDPQSVLTHYYLGVVYKTRGQRNEAIKSFQHVLELAPNTPLADEARKYINELTKKSD